MISTSLAEPAGSSSLLAAVLWIEGMLLGTTATVLAIIAVAMIGATMLTGRLNVRRTEVVILGCFILFGAPSIAAGIQAMLSHNDNPAQAPASEPLLTASPLPPASPASPTQYDPYAGAAVPTMR